MDDDELINMLISVIDDDTLSPDDNYPVMFKKPVEPKQGKVTLVSKVKTDKDAERRARMTQVMSKFATTVVLKPVSVKVASDTPQHTSNMLSWSKDTSISFHENALTDITDPATVSSIKGLSLHEVAHMLLSPNLSNTKLGKTINNNDWTKVYHLLEDQRIETQMTVMFSNVSDWLTASTIKQLMVAPPEQQTAHYMFIAGRKYLPPEIVQAYRDEFFAPHIIDQVDRIINDYISLDLSNPKTHALALSLIEELYNLVKDEQQGGGDQGEGNESDEQGNSNSDQYSWLNDNWDSIDDLAYHPTPNTKGKAEQGQGQPQPLTPQQSKDVADKVKEMLKNQPPTSPQQGQGQGIPQPSQAQQDEGQGQGEQGQQNEADGKGGEQAGQGGATSQVLAKHLNDVLERKSKDITTTIAQFNGEVGLDGKSVPPPERSKYASQNPVSAETLQAARSFGRELELLRAEYDPGWNMRTDQGRLNVQRYMTGKVDPDEAFDEWDMGRDDVTDIECVILLDISGSMAPHIENAYQSMWAIKRALDKINAATTVVAFGSRGYETLVYSANEQAKSTYTHAGLGGGTEPIQALRYARSVLGQSDRAIKILLPITDGAWSDSEESDKIITQCRQAGVLTALGMIGARSNVMQDTTIDTHGCEVAVPIDNMSELFQLAKSMVRAGIRKQIAR